MLFSLALFGLLVGLMIGRITTPEPPALERIEVIPGGLVLWFNEAPQVHGEVVEGTVAVLVDAQGEAASGQTTLAGRPVSWRVQKSDKGLLVTVVAARPLKGEWVGAPQEGRWRLAISLREE